MLAIEFLVLKAVENIEARRPKQYGRRQGKNHRVEPTGDRLKYLDRYDRATLELVNELYAEDFERFGYARVDPASRPVQAERRTSAGA